MLQNIHDGRTNHFYDTIAKCEDINDLNAFIDKHSAYFTDWKAFINHLLDMGGYSYSKFAALCGMSRNTIISWCEQGKVPRTREQFIRIGFAVTMTLDELNDFLQRYGKYSRLNVKNIDDAVTIFSLHNQLSYAQCYQLKQHFPSLLQDVLKERKSHKTKHTFYFSTKELELELISVTTLMEFESFVERNKEAFANSYVKLIDFIDSYIALNTIDADGKQGTLNSFLSQHIENPAIVAGFNTMISKLRCYGMIPSRMHLIALGIHLHMTAEDLNTMLVFAGMEPLCGKDKLESIVIFAAENAVIENPEIEFSNALLLQQYTNNPEIKEKCNQLIALYGLTDYQANNNVNLYDYITNALMSMDTDTTREILYLLGCPIP